MRGLKFALSAACVSFALGFAGSANAQLGGQQSQSATFGLKVCNNANENIVISLAHRVSPTDARFVVHGWFGLAPGCEQVTLPRGWVYYFALPTTSEGYWGGDTNICISIKGNYERIIDQNYVCKEGEEVLAPFQGVQVTNQQTYTININK
jgi:uncharacterized membrane protein